MSTSPLGRVVATERRPNTPHEFHFWTALDSPVGIGTIVRVDGSNPVNGQIPRVYGIVVEGFSYTDLQSPMHDVLGHDGSPENAGFAVTERSEIRLYSAAVLRQLPDEPLQPVPMGEVHLAEEEDVAVALRMDGYLKEGANTGIPIGVYRAGGTDSTIFLDADSHSSIYDGCTLSGAKLVRFRLSQPTLRRRRYFQDRSIRGAKDVAWFSPSG